MSTNNEPTNDTTFFLSTGSGIYAYGVNYKYLPGDKVYLVNAGGKTGPYKVELVDGGKYVLCDDNGVTANGGQSYLEDKLELYGPFA
ncbi:uncharacterized protein FMAN_07127 [Fusarium mangiferae]|uniref:Uncharacterized protein n=1 Tax=Fusarium mangiferae TaxID=192010 RepID=A0A1L7T2P3_FUSMA|nr:uncharacterized protein FMAN_07127 [Fusarium mangiferae]CVK92169.1 uncharacterized protein FMAN_07127 [Fusarium mangiferae]